MMDKLGTLKRVFGHDSFREGQERLIDALLSGRDVLGIMPTGAGKSICYQLPGLLLEGIALVVSPLISLMKDQVMSLKAMGVAAAYINSSLNPAQQTEALRRAALGTYKIIYVAPERLNTPQFLSFVQNANLSLLAVDEAHCVSQWGQDFRPSYLRIPEFIRSLPKRPPVAAFTATATERVREDILKWLGLQNPVQAVTGYNRSNLFFRSVKPSNRFAWLCEFLEDQKGNCGIIYCNTRKNVEEVCGLLQENGLPATRYHAGLSDQERKTNQEDFQYDRSRIMVATNAFGMGIDKPDVRFVVHYNMPLSMENYYQEAGRAGRDGLPSQCVLLYSGQDVVTGDWLIDHGDPNPDLTNEEQDQVRKLAHERLKQMTFYANSKTCLRNRILRYFGEPEFQHSCESCSVCLGYPFEEDSGAGRPSRASAEERARRKEARLLREEKRETRHETKASDLSSWEKALFESLKTLRLLIANQEHVPAYVIFSDATLLAMVKKKPSTGSALLEVSGVGNVKMEKYGRVFLSVLARGKDPDTAFQEEYLNLSNQPEETNQSSRPWDEDEDEALIAAVMYRFSVEDLALAHDRTPEEIEKRLRMLVTRK